MQQRGARCGLARRLRVRRRVLPQRALCGWTLRLLSPWGGASCSSLKFLPTPATARYGGGNHTAWGGGVIYDGGEYHLYAAAMSNACLLTAWKQNSRIEHATAATSAGPFAFSSVAVNTWAHNPAPLRLQSGEYVIWHIGDGANTPDGGLNCSGGPGPAPPRDQPIGSGRDGGGPGSNIHVSSSPERALVPAARRVAPAALQQPRAVAAPKRDNLHRLRELGPIPSRGPGGAVHTRCHDQTLRRTGASPGGRVSVHGHQRALPPSLPRLLLEGGRDVL